MHEPIVFVVDEDSRALTALTSALQRRFGADYRILADGDHDSATATLAEACDGGAEVALVIATSLDWLARVHDICPRASRCALVRYGDGASYPAVRQAIGAPCPTSSTPTIPRTAGGSSRRPGTPGGLPA